MPESVFELIFEVIEILMRNRWIQKKGKRRYGLNHEGCRRLGSEIRTAEKSHLNIAAYGRVKKEVILKQMDQL